MWSVEEDGSLVTVGLMDRLLEEFRFGEGVMAWLGLLKGLVLRCGLKRDLLESTHVFLPMTMAVLQSP